MRGSMIIGMVAGSIIGATAAMMAMPYIQPEMRQVIKKGKRAINQKMEQMKNM